MSETIEIINSEDKTENHNDELNSSKSKVSFGRFAVIALLVAALLVAGVAAAFYYVTSQFDFGKNKDADVKETRSYAAAPNDLGRYKPKPKPKQAPLVIEQPAPVKDEIVIRPDAVQPAAPLVVENTQEESIADKRFASGLNAYAKITAPSAIAEEKQGETKGFPSDGEARVLPKAKVMKNIDYTLIKGTTIPCTLETNIISEQKGYTSCVINQDVYSANAQVLLIEKGSKVTGEYKKGVKNGDRRLEIIWDRVITPYNVAIRLDSPTTDRLGAAGVTGHVDNRWGTRIGSALLVSLISDALEIAADNSKDSQVIVESETTETSQKLAEKILDKNINLSPIIYITEGQMINIYVANDVDMSSIYSIRGD